MVLNLPQDAWCTISLHLSTPDILSFLTVHPNIHGYLSSSSSFWARLLARDRDEEEQNLLHASITKSGNDGNADAVAEIRKVFMLQSYKSTLPKVQWLPLDINRSFPVTPREGHMSCVLPAMRNYKSLVVTGGFCDDDSVTVMRIPSGYSSYRQTWGWDKLHPINNCSFVYGATLTALPPVQITETISIVKAVQFGGFQGGGYSGETNEVWVLTIKDEWDDEECLTATADWIRIQTLGDPPRARAYHTATLIHDRYLFVVGGMTSEGCILDENILDTKTWTWTNISMSCRAEPAGRHGHSVLWDNRRDRLVMFGGGSGRDLIRSGVDNNEVWELQMNGIMPEDLDSFLSTSSTSSSKFWEWNRLHGTNVQDEDSSDEEDDNDDEMEVDSENNQLSPAQALCLGRCHNSIKVAPDTALLMFGGGRVNTNGVLGYDLRTNKFFQPEVSGALPMPRFTGIASYLDTEGYVFVHGGFNTAESGSIQDITLLDVAPYMSRDFTSLDIDTQRTSFGPISDEEATVARNNYRSGIVDDLWDRRSFAAFYNLMMSERY